MSNGADTPKTQEEIDKEKRKKKGLTAGGFLSLLPSIAGAIPGLLPSKQKGALERMQAGKGAGAQAARAAASEAGRRTAGNLGGRGSSGQVRAGVASAERQTAIGAREAGRIGAQEGIIGTQLLLDEERRRRGSGLQLGTAAGGAFAGALGVQTAALDQGPGAKAGSEVGGALTSAGLVDPVTGLSAGGSDGFALSPEAASTVGGASLGEQALTGLQQQRQSALPDQTVPQEGTSDQEVREQQASNLAAINKATFPQKPGGTPESAAPTPIEEFERAITTYKTLVTRDDERSTSERGGADEQAMASIYKQRLLQAVSEGLLRPEMAVQALEFHETFGEELDIPAIRATTGAGSR